MNDSPTLEMNQSKIELLEAAKRVLLSEGYSGLATRAIASAANTQMSQIRYHFGSKEGIVLALFEHMNAQLIERQTGLMTDPSISLSTKWDLACDYLDADINSGYVRVLHEMLAVGYSNLKVGKAVRISLALWVDLLTQLVRDCEGLDIALDPFSAEDVSALVHAAFIGGEAQVLIGSEGHGVPTRRALRKFGQVIRFFETKSNSGGK